MKRKRIVLGTLMLLFAATLEAQTQQTKKQIERAMEVNLFYGQSGFAGKDLPDMPRGRSWGGGFEMYLHPRFSTGVEFLHSSSGKASFQGIPFSVSRDQGGTFFRAYATTGKIQLYGQVGQGYLSNKLHFGGQSVSRDAYAFPLAFGGKINAGKYSFGGQVRVTYGGGVRSTEKLINVNYSFGK